MIRWLLTITAFLLLQGCSAIKLGYQQMPTLTYWWLDSAISFNDAQTARTKEALANIYRWHRSQELSTYLDPLQGATEMSQGNLQAGQVCSTWAEAQTKMDRTVRVAITQAVPVVQMLGPSQLSHLARHFESKNEDWNKEWLKGNAAERLERRLDKTLERYRLFYGDLNPQQIALIKNQISQSDWHPEWGRQDRLRREQDLLSTLRRLTQNNAPAAQVETALYGVWQRWFMPPDEAGQALMKKMTLQVCDNLAQLHNTTSPEQRQRATRTLRGYELDIRDLIKP